jgi:hypothetical protein
LALTNYNLNDCRAALWLGLVTCCVVAGCQHRGQTDLYVDSMAAEIRDLEDQLYWYDHEYRLLEQELESTRRRNEAIMKSQADKAPSVQPLPADSSFDFLPKKSLLAPEPETIPTPTPNSGNGRSNSATETPKSAAPPTQSPTSDPAAEGTPPALPAPQTPKTGDLLPSPPSFPTSKGQPTKVQGSSDFDFNGSDLELPNITTGAASPPRINPSQLSVSPDRDLELSLSKVDVPTQLASGLGNTARITAASPEVTDKRIVELHFQPALSRSVSFDDDNRDDGLYLVLQPKNEQGQVVPLAGAMTVEVLDPTRSEGQMIIGTWHYSLNEVQSKIQPIGSKQGIHLTLPWNGPNPKSDRLNVIATMQFENGRKVIAKKEFYINSGNGLKTVWTPRSGNGEALANRQLKGPIVMASAEGESPADIRNAVQSLGSFPAPELAPAPGNPK